jgi:hypothetical protein
MTMPPLPCRVGTLAVQLGSADEGLRVSSSWAVDSSCSVVEPDAVADDDEAMRSVSDGMGDMSEVLKGGYPRGEGQGRGDSLLSPQYSFRPLQAAGRRRRAGAPPCLCWRPELMPTPSTSLALYAAPSLAASCCSQHGRWLLAAFAPRLERGRCRRLPALVRLPRPVGLAAGCVRPLALLYPHARTSRLTTLVSPGTPRAEHGISGEVLVMMESDDLRDVGVTSLGLRLGVLKAVEALKVEQGLSSSHDDGNEYDTSCASSCRSALEAAGSELMS